MSNVGYLIGSGLSVPFGMPSLSNMDKFILSKNDAFWHTDQHFYVDLSRRNTCNHGQVKPDTIRRHLLFVKKQIEHYYSALGYSHSITYEDVYDYLVQFLNVLDSEYENPIMDQHVLMQVAKYPIISKRYRNARDKIAGSIIYISDMVIHLLQPREYPDELNNTLSKLLLLENTNVKKHIFTLNHDTILDDFLRTQGIDINDGFVQDGALDCFNVQRLYQNACTISFVKLHGSINYYSNDGRIIKSDDRNYAQNGSPVYGPYGSAYLNIGKINKLINYSGHFFEALTTFFNYTLTNSIERLVVIGYGFNDKGMNNYIANWFSLRDSNKLIIIHRDSSSLAANARGAIQRLLLDRTLITNNRLILISKWFEELDDELRYILST